MCVAGYIRPEFKFMSVEHLVDAIKKDISIATERLDEPIAKPLARKLEEFVKSKTSNDT